MRALFTYGPGIPRYLGMWLVLTPVLVVGLTRLRVPPAVVGLVFLTTLPSLSRNPPPWFGLPGRLWVLGASCALLAAWLVARVRAGASRVDDPSRRATSNVHTRAVLALVLVALALRVPLAWWDPGISDIPTSSEIAARQLLNGHNPYTLPNPDTQVGHYQYPAGSILAHLPFVAAVPERLLGEEHLGVRLALWLEEALAVVLLAWAGAAAGRPRGGLVAAFAYAVHPTLVRESGMTVANDLILALLVVAAAVALSRRRPLLAGVLAGLAVSVKPVAVVVVPVLWLAGGWQAALAALAVPAALQAPFFLWPTVGFHGVRWIVEPVGRPDTLPVLRANSSWWPLYAWLGNGRAVLRAAEGTAIALSVGAAAWAGAQLRRAVGTPPSLARAAAALSLPLLVSYALASMQRTNYQDWYLTGFILCAGLAVPERRAAPAYEPAVAVAG